MRANDIMTVTAILALSFLAQGFLVSHPGAEMPTPAVVSAHVLRMMTNYSAPALPPEDARPPAWLVSP